MLHWEFWRSLPSCAVVRRNSNYYTIACVVAIRFIASWQAVNGESYVGVFLREGTGDVTRLCFTRLDLGTARVNLSHTHLEHESLSPSYPQAFLVQNIFKILSAANSRCLYIRGVGFRASFSKDRSEECIIQLVLASMRRFTKMMQEPLAWMGRELYLGITPHYMLQQASLRGLRSVDIGIRIWASLM